MAKNKQHDGRSGHHGDHEGHGSPIKGTKLIGTKSDNTLVGTEHDDKISGLKGDDKLYGNAGNDLLIGGKGNDLLLGGDGNDVLYGDQQGNASGWGPCLWWKPKAQGDDYLDGGAGNDKLFAGRGDDVANFTLSENHGARDFYDGGKGSDTLQLTLTHAEAQLASVQADIAAFESFLESTCYSEGRAFHFTSFDLTVRGFEDLEIKLVGGGNSAPVAQDDAAPTSEDTPVSVNMLANDIDVDGNDLSALVVSGPAHGTLGFNPDGTVTYTPDADFFGADSFTYRASDGSLNSNVATVAITVNAVNDPPDAVNDAASVDEDSGATAIDVLVNDSSAPDAGETLSISQVSQGANGAVTITGGGTGLTYTPNANFVGADSFTYTISDGNGGSDTATVAVTVNAVNDAPIAQDDNYAGTGADGTGPVRVAVIGGGTTTYNAAAAQLNDSTAFDIHAVAIPVTLYTTQAEWEAALADYDVVAIGGSGQADDFGNSSLFPALRSFVDEGGGVVSAGWFARALAGLTPAAKADADYVTPVTTAGYTALAPNAAITVLDSSHPITSGVPSFVSPEFHELANALDPSATALATGGAAGLAAVAYDEVGQGLTVYLGGIYFADPIYTPDTRSGTLDKLFEQAVVWAAGTATNEDTPLTIPGSVLLENDTDANGDTLVISSVVPTSTRGAAVSFDEATGSILYNPAASAALQALAAGAIVTDSFEYQISDGHGGTDIASVNVTVAVLDDVTSSTAGIEGLIQALVPIDADVLL